MSLNCLWNIRQDIYIFQRLHTNTSSRKYIMNYWDNLPCELQNEVLRFPATTIQKIWRGRIAPAKQSLNFVNGLMAQNNLDHTIDTTSPIMLSILKYCSKHARIGVDEQLWPRFISAIDYDLWTNQYTGGPGAFYYTCIQLEVPLLERRLGLRQGWTSDDDSDW